jgi:NAD(P)-dependent dehydrogenase (short-subunit alcohol dehydrogenase family)
VNGGFDGKSALVTGALGGIGSAVARALAARGTRLLLVDRPGADPGPLLAELEPAAARGDVRFHPADVRDPAAAETAVRRAIEAHGALDFLVLVAGVNRDAPVWRMAVEDWDFVLDVNLKGCFTFARAAAPHFRERKGGKIVAVSSINGMRGKFGLANYAASKAGVIGLVRTLARELGPSNVNVNAVAPGYIRTPMTAPLPEEFLEGARKESALGRIGEPADVANAVVFLLSDEARHVTGAVLPVDGGQTA